MYERKALDKILDKNLHINSKYHVIFKGMNAIAAMLLMGISGSVLAQSYTEVVHPSLDNYDTTVKNLISRAGNKYTYNFGGGDLNISKVYQDHIKGIDVSGGYQIKVSNLANLKLETDYAKFLHAVYFYAGTYQSEGNTYDKKLEYGDGLIEVNNNTALGTFKSDGFHIEGIANTNLTEPSVILGDLTIKSTVDGQGISTLTGTFGFADGIHLTSQNVIVKGGNVDITSKAKGVDQAISYGIFADNADNSITLDSAKISAISTGNHSKNGSAAYGIRLDKSTQVKIDGAIEISAYVEDTQEVIARGLDFEDENNDKGSEGIFLGDNIIEATAKAQNNAYVTAVLAKNQSTIVLGKSTICAKTVLTGGIDTENLKLESFGIKVVVITGWDNSDVPKQIRLCGELFGKQEQAEELVDFYQKPVDYINEQLKQVTDRKKVYWEYGDDYSTCIPGTSNDGWHNMILMAGGINIFGDASLAGKDIDPEQILTEDPDLIVKIYAGKNVIGNSGVFTAPPQEEFAEKADEMLKRPGWKDLKAVKEGNFYLNTAFMSGGLGKMIGAAYMAKWLYPDLMTDLDPDAIFTQWMKYQGFEPNAPHYYHVPAQG